MIVVCLMFGYMLVHDGRIPKIWVYSPSSWTYTPNLCIWWIMMDVRPIYWYTVDFDGAIPKIWVYGRL